MDSGVCPPLQYQATYFHCPKKPLRECSWDTELTVVTAASDEPFLISAHDGFHHPGPNAPFLVTTALKCFCLSKALCLG